jgi:hypothetical protein
MLISFHFLILAKLQYSLWYKTMFGIHNFEPPLITSLEQLNATHGPELSGLVGFPIETTWALWDRYSESWFTEWPIILQINGKQLEVFVLDMDKMGVSWDAIDPKAPLFENSDGAGDYLEWRENSLPELIKVQGHKIIQISVIEYKYSMQVLRDPQKTTRVGKTIDFGWLLHGLEFKMDNGYLSISNALSGCAVSKTPIKDKAIRKKVIAHKSGLFWRWM